MMSGMNLLQADFLSIAYTKKCCGDLHCAVFCWASVTCTTLWLGLPQAAWGSLLVSLSRKGQGVEGEKN